MKFASFAQAFLFAALGALSPDLGHARDSMMIEYVPYFQDGNFESYAHLYLEGPVDYVLDLRLANEIAQHPDVKFILIGESPGGSLYGGIRAAKVIRDSGLHLQVLGPTASAAAIMSTGASGSISFASDKDFETEVLFHCAYQSGSDVCDGPATRDAAKVLEELTPYSSDWWYEFLMTKTTPGTVVAVSLVDLFGHWDCWEGRGMSHCTEK